MSMLGWSIGDRRKKKKPGPPAWVLDFLFVLSPVAGPASCGELQSSYSQETCVSVLLTQGTGRQKGIWTSSSHSLCWPRHWNPPVRDLLSVGNQASSVGSQGQRWYHALFPQQRQVLKAQGSTLVHAPWCSPGPWDPGWKPFTSPA